MKYQNLKYLMTFKTKTLWREFQTVHFTSLQVDAVLVSKVSLWTLWVFVSPSVLPTLRLRSSSSKMESVWPLTSTASCGTVMGHVQSVHQAFTCSKASATKYRTRTSNYQYLQRSLTWLMGRLMKWGSMNRRTRMSWNQTAVGFTLPNLGRICKSGQTAWIICTQKCWMGEEGIWLVHMLGTSVFKTVRAIGTLLTTRERKFTLRKQMEKWAIQISGHEKLFI